MAVILRRMPNGDLELADGAEESTANAAVIAAQAAVVAAQAAAAKVDLFNSAPVYLFPAVTNLTVTLTAGGANAFGLWAEIVDSAATTLSSVFAAAAGYISDMTLYLFSVPNEMYSIELSYGVTNIVIGRVMVNADWTYVMPVKSRIILAGEVVYYRMMANTGGATCRVFFRYFYQ